MRLCAVAEREASQRSAFAEAERRIARTIRAMYEVGHRLPAASLTLEAAQQEEERNREVCCLHICHSPVTTFRHSQELPNMHPPALLSAASNR